MQPSDFPIVADTYRFACTRCGECCFDQRVYLEPRDVFHLGAERTIIENDAGIWRCRLVFVRWPGRGEKCHYLQYDGEAFGCELHGTDKKPFVCSLSPLARAHGEAAFRLVPPVDGCPGMGQGPPKRIDHTEAMAWSAWYQRDIVPHIERDEARFRRAFSFHCLTLGALDAHLRALVMDKQTGAR